MIEKRWDPRNLWWLAVPCLSCASFFVGIAVGRVEFLHQPAVPEIEEPEKTTRHLHLHMESCDKKERFGL